MVIATETAWLHHAAEILWGGRENVCQVGHDAHLARCVRINLNGPSVVPDLPATPPEHARKFRMQVWDWSRYQNHAGLYCSGQDEVSKAIDMQGIWEGFETRVALEILDADEPGIVIDFGAHVGWFTLLALTADRPTLAVEADPENLALLMASASSVGRREILRPCRSWIGAESPKLTDDGPRVRFVKIDIEGHERSAVRVCEQILQARLVDYLMMEASPEFPLSDTAGTVAALEGLGYFAYLVPTKGETLEPDPLAACRAQPAPAVLDSQRTLLFERAELVP